MSDVYHLDYQQMGIMPYNCYYNIYTYSIFAEKVLRTTANTVNCIDSEAARNLRMVSEMVATRSDEIAQMSFYGPEKNGISLHVSERPVLEFGHLSIATKDDEAVFLDTVYNYDDVDRYKAKKRLEEDLRRVLDRDFSRIDGRILYNLYQIWYIEYGLYKNGYNRYINTVCYEQEKLIETYKARSYVISTLVRRAIRLLYDRLSGVKNDYFCTLCGYYFEYDEDLKNCPSCGGIISMCIPWMSYVTKT